MNPRAEPDLIERRLDKPYDEKWPGRVIARNETPADSGDRSFLGAAARAVFAMFGERVCVCPPAERIVEPDGTCFRCLARVMRRAPFRAER